MKTIIFTLLLFVSFATFSQGPFGSSTEHLKKNLFFVELMGGTVLPSMKYSDTPFDNYQPKNYFDKTGGLAIRFEYRNLFSVSTQVSYSGQGVYFPDNNDYQLHTNYLNVFVPVELDYRLVKRKKKAGPSFLIYAGPYAAKLIGGHLHSNVLDSDLTENDITLWDYGLEGGVGLRIPTYSLNGHSNLTIKASYYHGLANSFPEASTYDSEQMNERILSEVGSRYHHGFKLTLTYGISLEKKEVSTFTAGGDGKKTYKKFLVK